MERRRHPRINQPIDGHWQGSSGTRQDRIVDLGLGGCFVQTFALPRQGEKTTITLNLPAGPLALTAEVAYVITGMGFGVKFVDMTSEMVSDLDAFIESLMPARHQP